MSRKMSSMLWLVGAAFLLTMTTARPAIGAQCDYDRHRLEDIGEGAHPTFSVDGDWILFNSKRGQELGTGLRLGAADPFRIYRTPRDPLTGTWSTEGPQVKCLTCDHPRPLGAEGTFDGTPQVRLPNGDKILFVSSRDFGPAPLGAPGGGTGQEVYVMDPDGSNPVRLTFSPPYSGNYHAQWSPDGTKILWGRNYQDFLTWALVIADYVEDQERCGTIGRPTPCLENEIRLTATTDTTWYEPHGFSPDGGRILFTNTRSNQLNGEIYTMELDFSDEGRVIGGRDVRRLTNHFAWDEHAHFNPDGTKIAWITSRDHPSPIVGSSLYASWILGLPPTLDTFLVIPGVVLLAADGAQPVSSLALDFYVMNSDGSEPLRVTYNQGGADNDWSPDGTRIVFRNRGNRVGLLTFDCEGASLLDPIDEPEPRQEGLLDPLDPVTTDPFVGP